MEEKQCLMVIIGATKNGKKELLARLEGYLVRIFFKGLKFYFFYFSFWNAIFSRRSLAAIAYPSRDQWSS